MSSTTIAYRRSQFADPVTPIAGVILQSKSGKSLLRVTKATLFRRSGEPTSRDLIRLNVDRMSVGSEPDGAEILPWPIRRPVATPAIPQAPRVIPATVRFHAAARASTMAASTKSRKQVKRDLATQARVFAEDRDSPVPKAQRAAVMAEDGVTVFSPPKVTSSSWADPDDSSPNRRTAKLAHGYRRVDPIVVLKRSNPAVEAGHVVASDCYRMAWERGPGGSLSFGRDLMFTDRQFGSGSGPTEVRCEAMRKWLQIQSGFRPRAQDALQAVVLDRMAVSTWANHQHGDRRYWTGYVIGILDQLLVLFSDDVDTLMRTEHLVTD